MTDISNNMVESCEIEVRSGIGGESEDNIFRYVFSSTSTWAKIVDYPFYSKMAQNALSAARDLVQITGRNVTLKYSVDFDKR